MCEMTSFKAFNSAASSYWEPSFSTFFFLQQYDKNLVNDSGCYTSYIRRNNNDDKNSIKDHEMQIIFYY